MPCEVDGYRGTVTYQDGWYWVDNECYPDVFSAVEAIPPGRGCIRLEGPLDAFVELVGGES